MQGGFWTHARNGGIVGTIFNLMGCRDSIFMPVWPARRLTYGCDVSLWYNAKKSWCASKRLWLCLCWTAYIYFPWVLGKKKKCTLTFGSSDKILNCLTVYDYWIINMYSESCIYWLNFIICIGVACRHGSYPNMLFFESNCDILMFRYCYQIIIVILGIDINIWQNLTAGDDINLLRHSLQVIQDYSDAVWGIDDGTLRSIQLSCRTVYLSKKPPVIQICKHTTFKTHFYVQACIISDWNIISDDCSLIRYNQKHFFNLIWAFFVY